MTQFDLLEGDRTGVKVFRRPGLARLGTILAAVLGLVFLLPGAASAGAGHVVLLVIDGPRHTEFLDEPGLPHARVLGTVLAPAGVRITDFQNRNRTVTMVGHGTLATGTAQLLANDGTERPDRPTLFELIRKERGLPQGSVRLVAGKDKIAALSYSTDPAYGAAYGATVDASFRQDPETFTAAVAAITADPRPVFTMINFPSVDYAGHAGVWENYLAAIARADSLAGELWNVIEADPVLAGDTDLFVVADHGRHDDAHGGFVNHGDGCVGCRTLPFVALGPDIRPGVTSDRARVQEDVAPTIAEILGLTTPPMEGWVMQEILVGGQVGVPSIAPAPVALRAWPNPFRGTVTVGGRDGGVLKAAGEAAAPTVGGRRGAALWAPGFDGSAAADFGLRAQATLPGFAAGSPAVEIFDVTGRLIFSAPRVATWPWRWDGRDAAGREAPPGVYWIRARSAEGAAGSVRAIKIR